MLKWLLIVLAVLAPVASAADIAGTWKATIETANGPMESTFVFKVDGANLTGTTSSRMGEAQIVEGKVDGDGVTFAVAMNFGDQQFKLNYAGKVNGNEMKLTITMPNADRTFEMLAKKVN